jgi:hypothetical protein
MGFRALFKAFTRHKFKLLCAISDSAGFYRLDLLSVALPPGTGFAYDFPLNFELK